MRRVKLRRHTSSELNGPTVYPLATILLRWTEPQGARRSLIRMAGGFHYVFIGDLLATGVPIVLMMSAVWLFALFAGTNVMPLPKALVLFVALSSAVSALFSVLYLLIPEVQITSTQIIVGVRKWGRRSVRGYGWEAHQINGTDCTVLHLSTRGKPIRVALAPDIHREDVERALVSLGLERKEFDSTH